MVAPGTATDEEVGLKKAASAEGEEIAAMGRTGTGIAPFWGGGRAAAVGSKSVVLGLGLRFVA